MTINSEEVKSLLSSIDELIELKCLIRTVVPSYELSEDLNEKFVSLLKALQNKLQPFFLKYIKIEAISEVSPEKQIDLKEQLLNLFNKNTMALISSNNAKKKLKNIGVDPRFLIITGGPLSAEEYKLINPNITDDVIKGVRSKLEKIFAQLKSDSWTDKDLVFIYEPNNPTDKLIRKRLEEVEKLIGKPVKMFEIKDWKDIEPSD